MGTSRTISGPSKGAGEMPAIGPGREARGKGMSKSVATGSDTPSGKAPKGMKIEREGE